MSTAMIYENNYILPIVTLKPVLKEDAAAIEGAALQVGKRKKAEKSRWQHV